MQLIINRQPREFIPLEGPMWKIDDRAGRISVCAPPFSDIFIDPHRNSQTPTAASPTMRRF